ncbi:hypothetical protein D9V32_13475 [Mycetocola tolaasinivorans]|uniref:Uncharacterized protein n=1 Tax=Mycetocola tolaasinivorans TaxID=76635 RepID=A0A3L7A222_9MICO|nr:hypothetical protein [Mycetocola tolaasinivorans]RLP74353.1 hypothetical protein D9V32_13475 [Mycetocola tolaasinivorans]
MANAKVKLNLRGINQLMTSREATSAVVRAAKRIQQNAGPDFEVNVVPHRYTARAYVRPANIEGAVAEAKDKKLTRAVHGAR